MPLAAHAALAAASARACARRSAIRCGADRRHCCARSARRRAVDDEPARAPLGEQRRGDAARAGAAAYLGAAPPEPSRADAMRAASSPGPPRRPPTGSRQLRRAGVDAVGAAADRRSRRAGEPAALPRRGRAGRPSARRLRQPERGGALLRRRAGRRGLAGRGARRFAGAGHHARRCARSACRRRRSIEPAADAAQFDSEALWARLRARDWRGAASWSCAATAAATGWPSGWRERRAGGARRPPTGAAPPLDATEARRAATRRWPSPRRTPGSSAAREAIDHLERAGRAPRRPHWRRRTRVATHPRIAARARQLGFADVARVPARRWRPWSPAYNRFGT